MEERLAECLAANRIYTTYEGGIHMLRKLFDGRRKFVTLAVLAVILVSALAIGFSGVAGLKNGKASGGVVSSSVPIFTESSLPPVALFEQVAPFDVVLDARGWKNVLMTTVVLGYLSPKDAVSDMEGFAVVRVEKGGRIYVRDAQLKVEDVAVPVADAQGNLKFVKTTFTVTGIDSEPLPFQTKAGMRTAPQVGQVDSEGFFDLPWIVQVKTDQFPEPFSLYFQTWGFIGKDILGPGVSYADFGSLYGMKDAPEPVQRGFEILVKERAKILGEPFVKLFTNGYNCNQCVQEYNVFARKFLANLNKVSEEVREDLQRAFLFVHALLMGGR